MLGSFDKVTYNKLRWSDESTCKFCNKPDKYCIFTDDGEFRLSRLYVAVCEDHLNYGLMQGFHENNKDRRKRNMPEFFDGLRIYLKRTKT